MGVSVGQLTHYLAGTVTGATARIGQRGGRNRDQPVRLSRSVSLSSSASPSTLGIPDVVQVASEPHIGYNAAKRALDIVVALAVLLTTAPVWLIATAAILIESGRPVLFRQERLGCLGRRFVCIKFRTMVPDAESRIREAMQAAAVDGPEFKQASDPRVTRLGRMLRAWSVDELPQFINVLRSEMSVVGPRPIAGWEAEYQGHGWRRLAVKPGLTGTWQISGPAGSAGTRGWRWTWSMSTTGH